MRVGATAMDDACLNKVHFLLHAFFKTKDLKINQVKGRSRIDFNYLGAEHPCGSVGTILQNSITKTNGARGAYESRAPRETGFPQMLTNYIKNIK